MSSPTPRYVCSDCPDDGAVDGFIKRRVAEMHARRTGHTVRDTQTDEDLSHE